MDPIAVAFWNLQNLFDTTASPIAADLEFTPADGWTDAVVDAKVAALVEVVATMFGGRGPDLFGICEIENRALVERFARALNRRLGRTDLTFAHDEAEDLRGIDCSLIYSRDIFEPAGEPQGHLVFLRFRTRDIFQVPLRVRATGAELTVFVNHWPSRRQGGSEPYRITVASHQARLVDDVLKLSRQEVLAAPSLEAIAGQLDARWNRNVLIMGDLNDDPFDASVLSELGASNSLDRIEEDLPVPRGEPGTIVDGVISRSDAETYLRREPPLYNLSWGPLGISGEGSIFFSRDTNRTKQMFDQIIVSRGLLLGQQGLRMQEADFGVHTPRIMWTNSGLPADTPRHRIRPRAFDRVSLLGASDHFPVLGLLLDVPMA
jgi:hypothetical protein